MAFGNLNCSTIWRLQGFPRFTGLGNAEIAIEQYWTLIEFWGAYSVPFNRELIDDLSGRYVSTLPMLTFSDRITVHAGDDDIELVYFGRAHTDNDILVYVSSSKTVFPATSFNKGSLAPRPMPATNICPTVSPDGECLFFASKREIYWVSAEVISRLRPE